MIAQSSLFSHKFHRRQVGIDTTKEANNSVFVMVNLKLFGYSSRIRFLRFFQNPKNATFLHFYPRHAMLARVIAIAIFVRPSVCHEPVLCQNEESWRHDFFTIR